MQLHLRAICQRVALTIIPLLFPSLAVAQHYTETDLVSNVGTAPVVNDIVVRNAWGLVHGPATPWWIANNASGTSTLVNAASTPVTIPSLVVTVPQAAGQTGPGTPTGVVFNGRTADFLLAPAKPALFIWVTEDGTISGWNPSVDATHAIVVVDHSVKRKGHPGAVFKGATIGEVDGKQFLFVANFRSGRIDVFDAAFHQVALPGDAFGDDHVPGGYAPFNVQGIGPNLYVTYAKQDPEKHDEVAGTGLGFVNIFSTTGKRVGTLQHGAWFNAPWGVTMAPAYFGEFSHAVLVGNFGDGTIAAFNPVTGRFLGQMLNPDGSTLTIDGLWGVGFGNGGSSGPGNTLFFTAGPADETNGLFGMLKPVNAELNENDEP